MRIACLLDTDFEDSEFRVPYNAYRAAGHEVVIIGFEAGKELKGKKGNETVRSERGIGDGKKRATTTPPQCRLMKSSTLRFTAAGFW